MKLSDAIALGRVTVNKWLWANLDGCALGMAANAVGVERKYYALENAWPWLSGDAPSCPGCGYLVKNCLHLVGHLFDSHVMKENWTLDQLIDWVRSVEPPEPEAQADQLEAMRISDMELSTGER